MRTYIQKNGFLAFSSDCVHPWALKRRAKEAICQDVTSIRKRAVQRLPKAGEASFVPRMNWLCGRLSFRSLRFVACPAY